MKFVTSALLSALMASSATAFWRMPCRSQTGLGRIDPIVAPGQIADHVHTIHGGGNFGLNTSYAELTAKGSCTSCGVEQDHSAYWTPALYFVYNNGTSVIVPQIGGMLAYYLYYLDNVKAFPEGFQMIAGDRNARSFDGPFPDTPLSDWPTDPTDQHFLQQRALGFNCLNYAQAPEPSLYRHVFPSKEQLDNQCKDGLRIELAFPSCGTGAMDSSDHRSHMAYPSLVKEGNCPKGYDVHYPFLFFETIWATNHFAGEAGQFVLSHGDPIGTGYHGDFMMGWESKDFLQQALDTCKNPSGNIQDCALFKLQSDSDAATCTFDTPAPIKNDDNKGPRSGLPIEVPIQYGPQNATAYPCYGKTTAASAPSVSIAPPSSVALPTVPYSAANPSVTATAPGGIVVNAVNNGAEPLDKPAATSTSVPTTSSPPPVESPATTQAPPPPPPPPASPSHEGPPPNSVYTTGNEVVEVFLDTVQVTQVVATVTVDGSEKHRRHMEMHAHNHHL